MNRKYDNLFDLPITGIKRNRSIFLGQNKKRLYDNIIKFYKKRQ